MIIDEIKNANVEAIKAKDQDSRAILSVVINKYMLMNIEKRSKGEEMTDTDVIGILQKTIKELIEEKEMYEKCGRTESAQGIEKQKFVCEQFLPKMMSEEEIKEVILSLENTLVPTVMKHFKANYSGKCDMGVVQKVLKEING